MKERNLVDLLINQVKHIGTAVALRAKKDGCYFDISWHEFHHHVIQISAALKNFGKQKGDRVALLSENRPEWPYADLAILSLGAVVVPIYPTSSEKEVEYILSNSEAKVVFLSSKDQFERLRNLLERLPFVKKIIIFDLVLNLSEKAITLKSFIEEFIVTPELEARFNDLVSEVDLDDLATIIYTSGTTGPPKGVMLTHRNFLINCYDSKEALPISERDTVLSFLPLSHVFERMGGYYLSLLCGATIAYAENMATVPNNLIEVKPTIMCAVPRFFEKMYSQILSQMNESSELKKKIFSWALKIGNKHAQYKINKKSMPAGLKIQYAIAHKLVYSKIYQKMGGRLRSFISGGAPLPKELAEFFYSVGILILEGYGLTETSPVIAVNRFRHFKFGSVGLPLKHVETKISEDGEIMVKGPTVMKGYYNHPEATAQVIQNGWFCTGDLGYLDSDGFLYITGRKKDIIKTSGGKMVSPQNIENAILADGLISQIVLIGDKRNYITALVVPNFDQLKTALGLVVSERPEDLVKTPQVHKLIRNMIEAHTHELAQFEKIKYFTLLVREFSQEKGEMTLTLKIKRQDVSDHYKEVIDKMYQTDDKDDARDRIFFVI